MRISDWSSDVCSSDLKHRVEGGAGGAGIGLHQQICRRLSGPPLLSGLRAVGRGRDAGDRPREGAVRLRLCQRPAAFGRAGERRRQDRKSVVWGRSVSISVDPGGRRLFKNKKKNKEK